MYVLSLRAGAQNEQGELSALQKLQFTGNSFRGRMLQEGGRKDTLRKRQEGRTLQKGGRKDVPGRRQEGRTLQKGGRKDAPERRQEGCLININ